MGWHLRMHGPPPCYNRTVIGASPAKETIGLGREEMLCCLNLVTIDERKKTRFRHHHLLKCSKWR